MLCPGFVNTGIYDSARNRQSEYGESANPTPAGPSPIRAALEERRQTMMQQAEIGDLVFEAIRDRELYIIPTDSDALENSMRQRFENIVERRTPPFEVGIM